jgi:hypothetical protein
MKIKLRTTVWLSTFFLFLGSSTVAQADNQITLSTTQSTVILTSETPVDIKISPSDQMTRTEELYFNSTLYSTPMWQEGFEARTVSMTSTDYLVRISATRPIKNGTYKLAIRQYSSQILNITVIVNFKAEDLEVRLTTDSPTLTLSANATTEFKVYLVDLYGLNKEGQLFINKQSTLSRTEGYEARVIGQTDTYYNVTIKPTNPLKNGTYPLILNTSQSQKLNMIIIVNIDSKSEGLYSVDFDFGCDTPVYNQLGKCTLTPSIEGAGRLMVKGKYFVSYSYRNNGSGSWMKRKPFNWDISEGVILSLSTVTKPLEVKVSTTFQGKIYSFEETIFPEAKLALTSPNAAIVGREFSLVVRTIKQYSGNCYVNNPAITFRIKGGYGMVRVYGKTPGDLYLNVRCQSSAWADSEGKKFVFIRA